MVLTRARPAAGSGTPRAMSGNFILTGRLEAQLSSEVGRAVEIVGFIEDEATHDSTMALKSRADCSSRSGIPPRAPAARHHHDSRRSRSEQVARSFEPATARPRADVPPAQICASPGGPGFQWPSSMPAGIPVRFAASFAGLDGVLGVTAAGDLTCLPII